MKHVKIEDGKIVWGPGYLPKTWKNISGLNNLSAEGLRDLGWLPLVQAKSPYPQYVKSNISYEVNAEEVIEKCDFTEIVPEEPEQQV